jgi:LuxR family maltose regulon positive regulatory protein
LLQVGKLQVAGSLKDYVKNLVAAFDQTVEIVPNFQPATLEPVNMIDPLSERERKILRLVAAGLKNGEIADQLVVAPSTIHWHVKNIYSKLGVHSRTQAVARATDLGILE